MNKLYIQRKDMEYLLFNSRHLVCGRVKWIHVKNQDLEIDKMFSNLCLLVGIINYINQSISLPEIINRARFKTIQFVRINQVNLYPK